MTAHLIRINETRLLFDNDYDALRSKLTELGATDIHVPIHSGFSLITFNHDDVEHVLIPYLKATKRKYSFSGDVEHRTTVNNKVVTTKL